ncbi:MULTISPECIES: AfsR/SARP family transcriptional regulator [unclassified Paracoccus (in: a-proteobacteria)]|uniref:AfsR/SARP family transcriptional regulator n=1 Tax=unclassified Paracoccus (in: a-proteobacteria) TaxID=2688777 RepID=UPI0012B19C07|nr:MULTISPECIES: BTAD domain-containing putative transcriptional regulator [unclassified Paracoccus (in: a-proteobacteria)]UXU76319.1 SARP family transcriptional regulator [Paracoccus sp. SMMA_5]UXU82344.1 SARP family transcriptional regulator [Paracoccus sp. SMMA_5_TC]
MQLIPDLLDILDAVRLRKGRALLFFLIADRAPVHRTEKVTDLFWQNSDEQRAAASYRQAVKHIRRAMENRPGIALETSAGEIALRLPRAFDLAQELAALIDDPGWDTGRGGQIRLMIDQTVQLEGISASFDSWLAITRATLLAGLRQVLDARLADLGGRDPEAQRALAEFAVALEPANENVTRLLMRLDWQAGRPTRAIERYNTLYAHLDEAFDQEPEAETVELLAAIKLDPAGGGRQAPQGDRPPQISLSVALQDPIGDAGDLGSLTNVLFADLRMRMGRFREWWVVEPDAAQQAQVRILLRPFYLDGGLRLFVEVLGGQGGHLVWSEWIEQPQNDWEHKARLLLSNIANTLSVVVSDRSLSDSGSDVYDSWLRAQALLDSWSPETEAEAIGILRQITQRTPPFGPAHAELAGALNVRHVLLPGTFQTEEIKRDAMHHAIVAVSADPLDTRAHRVLAWCFCHMGYFDLAEFHFDQALTLNRSNALTVASCALGFAFSGDLGKAAALVAEAKSHARVLEPYHWIYLAAADYLCGNHAAAAEQCAAGSGLMPTVGGWHCAALWQLGRAEQAAQCLDAFLQQLRGQWQGKPDPTDQDILDWFLSIFPLRHEEQRRDLAEVLAQVAAWRGGRLAS